MATIYRELLKSSKQLLLQDLESISGAWSKQDKTSKLLPAGQPHCSRNIKQGSPQTENFCIPGIVPNHQHTHKRIQTSVHQIQPSDTCNLINLKRNIFFRTLFFIFQNILELKS
jgi:hypothetical protein